MDHAQKDQFVAVGCLEPPFFTKMCQLLHIDEDALPNRFDVDNWPELERLFGDKFTEKTRDEWTEIFKGTDACVTPVVEQVLDRRAPSVIDGLYRVDYTGQTRPDAEMVGMPAGHRHEDVIKDWSTKAKL